MTLTDKDTRRADSLAGLLRIYEFFSVNPDLLPLRGFSLMDPTGGDAKVELERARKWARAFGNADKSYGDALLTIQSKPGAFGPHQIGYLAMRGSVCTKTVTTVEREVTEPDPELVALAPMITHTVSKEVIEWTCPDSLLAT